MWVSSFYSMMWALPHAQGVEFLNMAVLKPFNLRTPLHLKKFLLLRSSKIFCLGKIYLLIFTLLEIKNEIFIH